MGWVFMVANGIAFIFVGQPHQAAIGVAHDSIARLEQLGGEAGIEPIGRIKPPQLT